MKKEFYLSLKRLNFIVLKKIAERRGFRVGGSRDTVELGEMETLLNDIKSRKPLKRLILIYSLVLIFTFILMAILLNFHLKFINFDRFSDFLLYY